MFDMLMFFSVGFLLKYGHPFPLIFFSSMGIVCHMIECIMIHGSIALSAVYLFLRCWHFNMVNLLTITCLGKTS